MSLSDSLRSWRIPERQADGVPHDQEMNIMLKDEVAYLVQKLLVTAPFDEAKRLGGQPERIADCEPYALFPEVDSQNSGAAHFGSGFARMSTGENTSIRNRSRVECVALFREARDL